MPSSDASREEAVLREIQALSEQIKSRPDSSAGSGSQAAVSKGHGAPEWWSPENAMTMSVAVLLFGVLVLGLAAWLIRRQSSTDQVLKLFGTITILFSALFLVVAGYSDQQISPVMGLLGTIAGYLLGKETGGGTGAGAGTAPPASASPAPPEPAP